MYCTGLSACQCVIMACGFDDGDGVGSDNMNLINHNADLIGHENLIKILT